MRAVWLLPALVLCLAPPLWAADPEKKEPAAFQVPYRLTDTQHVLVRAKINGKGPFNFILDTGAPALFVATDVSRKLGVDPDKKGWGTFDRLEIEGGPVVTKTRGRVEDPFQLEGMNGLGLAGVHLHGIIGYNVLARFRLEFDFTKDKMTWTPLDFEPPPPVGLGGKGGAPGGLDALGTFLKVVGALLGKKATPETALRGFLGVELADAGGAVEVKSVLARGPAATAGLKAGDRITHFQGKKVSRGADVRRLAAELPAGQAVRLTVARAGEKQQITFKLGEGL